MRFELNKEFVEELQLAIQERSDESIKSMVAELHPADVAEILGELEPDDAHYLFNLLPSELTADAISELEEDDREELLEDLSGQEIAHAVIDHMDSDDAADIISELPEEKQDEVLSNISDIEQAGDIVDLLNYDPDTAGGLMATELISVNENMTVRNCVEEIRKQAPDVGEYFDLVQPGEDAFLGYSQTSRHDRKLHGGISLQCLIKHPPNQTHHLFIEAVLFRLI